MKRTKEFAVRVMGKEWEIANSAEEMMQRATDLINSGHEVEYGVVGGFVIGIFDWSKIMKNMGGIFNFGSYDFDVNDFTVIRHPVYRMNRILLINDEGLANDREIPYLTEIDGKEY